MSVGGGLRVSATTAMSQYLSGRNHLTASFPATIIAPLLLQSHCHRQWSGEARSRKYLDMIGSKWPPSEIFLYAVQADPSFRAELMLVCRHWHNIMLSTLGIHSQLRIYWWTEKKDVERFGRRWLLDVTVDV